MTQKRKAPPISEEKQTNHQETTKKPKKSRLPKRVFKCGVRRLLTLENESQPTKWFLQVIERSVKNCSMMRYFGSMLANLFLLRCLNGVQEHTLPLEINQIFFVWCMRLMSAQGINLKPPNSTFNRKVDGITKTKQRDVSYHLHLINISKELKQTIQDDLIPFDSPEIRGCLDHLAKQMETNYLVHLSRNFPSWLKSYFCALLSTQSNLPIPKCNQRNPNKYINSIARKMAVYCRGYAPETSKGKPYLLTEFKQLVDPMKNSLIPFYSTKRQPHGLTNGALKAHYQQILPIAFQMLRFVENQFNELKSTNLVTPFRLWTLFPVASPHMCNIRIDNSTFCYMYHNAHFGEYSAKIKIPMPQKWHETINVAVLGKSPRIWTFTGSIITDGVSVGVQFERSFRPNEKVTKDDDDETKPKVDWKEKLLNEIDPLNRVIRQENKQPVVFGVDPGRKNILTITTNNIQTGKTSRTVLPSKQYHIMLNTRGKTKKLQRLTGDKETITSSPKTTDSDSFLYFCKDSSLNVAKYKEGYFSKAQRKNKWDTKINGPRIINSFIDHTLMQAGFPPRNRPAPQKKRIKRKAHRANGSYPSQTHSHQQRHKQIRQSNRRKEVSMSIENNNETKVQSTVNPFGMVPVLALGNAKFDSSMGVSDGAGSSCNSVAERVLKNKKGIHVFDVSEYNTTKNCNLCHQPTNSLLRKGNDGKRFKAWDTRFCQGQQNGISHHKPCHLHRDANAAKNIGDNIRPFL